MIKFIFRRLLMMIPVLIGVSFVIFSMLYFAPGDAADVILGDLATPEDKQLFRAEHGLDKPFLVQYFNYMKGVVTEGDLGTSYVTRQPVTIEIMERFPATLQLSAMSVFLAVVIGVTVGIISATRQYSFIDHLATSLSMIGVSMPNFWQGMMLIIIFSVALRWFPPSGFSTPMHWVLPAVTVGTNASANIMRMTRSSMLEIIRQDYIRTARAKGQTEAVVIWKHALKNALIPIITVVGLSFGRLLGGAVLTESIFSIAGVGKLMVDAIKLKNFPMVQGGVLFIAFVMSIVNLVVDVLYSFADPRIRSMYTRPRTRKAATAKEAA
ncbi:MAG TPA: ABC transporter permease [Spirochaetales bacterium]|nr:ABC transporter permease [Spirochaetales bacterium]HRY55063.1 ABC transporter permease [Spirochaetia bacterium]HRZ64222.1 ABC transporter permease [Spirochaetia bacterium]